MQVGFSTDDRLLYVCSLWEKVVCYEFVMCVPCWPSYCTVISDTVTVQELSLSLCMPTNYLFYSMYEE